MADPKRKFSAHTAAKHRGSHHICERKERDGLTVDRRPESLSTEMAILPRPRVLWGPGCADLHHGQSECSVAGYITADWSRL